MPSLLRLLLLHLLVNQSSVHGYGGFFSSDDKNPVLQTKEVIIFGINTNDDTGDTDVTMQVQADYEGLSDNFSWILPLMYEPELSIGSSFLFDTLLKNTMPTFTYDVVVDGVAEEPQPAFSTTFTTTSRSNSDDATKCSSVAFNECRYFMSSTREGNSKNKESDKKQSSAVSSSMTIEGGISGQFEHVLIQPGGDNDAASSELVLAWLDENDYVVPDGSSDLIKQYVQQGMMFLALRLQKTFHSTGKIQPIILKYRIPAARSNVDDDDDVVSIVPMQLSSISSASTPSLPIQVFFFSNQKATPGNYFSVDLDDSRADWLGCKGNQQCHITDMRARFHSFLQEEGIYGHAFVTEFVGPTSNVFHHLAATENSNSNSNSLAPFIDNINIDHLMNSTTPNEYLTLLTEYDVPAGNKVINEIIESYIPNEYTMEAPWICTVVLNTYEKAQQSPCYNYLTNQEFNVTGLTNDLNEHLFDLAIQAQHFIEQYQYVTRFYGQLSAEEYNNGTTKDPIFTFQNNDHTNHDNDDGIVISDVSNIRHAIAVPVCTTDESNNNSTIINALNISIQNNSYAVPAIFDCGTWFRTDANNPLFGMDGISTASKVTAMNYTLLRPTSGFFPPELLKEMVLYMEERLQPQQQQQQQQSSIMNNKEKEDGNTIVRKVDVDLVAYSDKQDETESGTSSSPNRKMLPFSYYYGLAVGLLLFFCTI